LTQHSVFNIYASGDHFVLSASRFGQAFYKRLYNTASAIEDA
jgi:hypothetical protein